ncbi:hypothetical protein NIES4103_62210 [Nostoc sp. NIES-4103]|nr:hypothetical protein NIES4103_62210 [Nostoc sp. NIES-4103]
MKTSIFHNLTETLSDRSLIEASAITKSFEGFAWRMGSNTFSVDCGRLKIIKTSGVSIVIVS